MGWTGPTTRATGDLITASIWNTDIVDNLDALRTSLDYAQITSDFTTTATTVDTAGTVVTGTSQAWDGADVYVEFYTPSLSADAQGGDRRVYVERGGTIVGEARAGAQTGAGDPFLFSAKDDNPPADTYSYRARAYTNTGTLTLGAGAGGSAVFVPAYLRVSSAESTT